jgi:hypothetical protein
MDTPRLTVALTFDHDANLGQRPECIGAPRILEQFIATARALPGVEFGRLDSYVERWQAGPG